MRSPSFLEVPMARLVLHARYFAPNAAKREGHLSYLMKYYGTREGVEKNKDETWKKEPESEEQKVTIEKLLKDVPEVKDTHEWEDFQANPTRGNASEVIRWGIEYMMQNGNPDIYLKYIAERPRVEKITEHGLFSQSDEPIDLNQTAKDVSRHPGNVWTMVFSLRRPDAERLGYNNADSWRNLCRAKAIDIAEAMKIPYDDFHWYAAFHNEGHHPHIHMVAYSTGEEGYLTKYGIDDIKSTFAKEIFKLDLEQIYKQETQYRNNLRQMAKEYMEQIKQLPSEAQNITELIPILLQIRKALPKKGKLLYGYMPKEVKNLVDEAVNRLEKNPKIAELYDLWYRQRCEIIATYTTNFPEKEPLAENRTFRDIKNAIIKVASEWQLSEEQMQELHDAVTDETLEGESLDELIRRIEKEHENTRNQEKTTELSQSNINGLWWLLNRIAKVFEDKKPANENGQSLDKKMYVRQEERKRELGMK